MVLLIRINGAHSSDEEHIPRCERKQTYKAVQFKDVEGTYSCLSSKGYFGLYGVLIHCARQVAKQVLLPEVLAGTDSPLEFLSILNQKKFCF